jgi:dUTP pyrophosphatase
MDYNDMKVTVTNDSLYQHMKRIREECFKVEVEVLDGGKLPCRANPTDAGFDVFATADVVIYPGQVQKHPLNIKMKLPKGTWAEITSKSGLGAKGLLVYAGVIDEGYRGVPHVVMSNIHLISGIDPDGYPLMRTEPIIVKQGEKLAQITMNPYSPNFYVEQVEQIETDTARGAGGFGSTGSL